MSKFFMMREDYLEQDFIKKIEDGPNGASNLIIWVSMLSLSAKNDGVLLNDDKTAMSIAEIGKITSHNEAATKTAIEMFKNMGLIEILDNGAIYIPSALDSICEDMSDGRE